MIRQIRHQMNQNIPILMSINQEFMQKLNDCIEAGISDYIVKPYTKEMLKLRIQNNLNLIDAFKKYLERKKDTKPLQTKITVNEVTVSSRRHDIKNLLKTKKRVSFFELFPVVSKEYVIATFLAILEMAKSHELTITQNDTFDDIICEVA